MYMVMPIPIETPASGHGAAGREPGEERAIRIYRRACSFTRGAMGTELISSRARNYARAAQKPVQP